MTDILRYAASVPFVVSGLVFFFWVAFRQDNAADEVRSLVCGVACLVVAHVVLP